MHFGALPAPYPIRPPLLRQPYIDIIQMRQYSGYFKISPSYFFSISKPCGSQVTFCNVRAVSAYVIVHKFQKTLDIFGSIQTSLGIFQYVCVASTPRIKNLMPKLTLRKLADIQSSSILVRNYHFLPGHSKRLHITENTIKKIIQKFITV